MEDDEFLYSYSDGSSVTFYSDLEVLQPEGLELGNRLCVTPPSPL